MGNEVNISLHPKQTEAFLSEATELLYGGSAGGGKSHLMRVCAITWCASIAGLQVYLFRRISEDLYKNHMEGAGGFFALLAPWFASGAVKYNSSKNFLSFNNGSKIWLSHCQHEKDKFKYQGAEIHVLMIDELTHFTESIYRYLRGRCRLGTLQLPKQYKGKFPRVLCGSNPSGVGHSWVKRTFIDFQPYGATKKTEPKDGGFIRQYLPALLSDNPSLSQDYAETLAGLGSPDLVRAMLNGDWDIVAGGAIDDVWRRDVHTIPRFIVPESWRLDRSFDWGSSHPFSVCWWAEATGEEITLDDGRLFCPPAGSLIQIAEWYGTKEIGTNKGLKLSAKDIARGIKKMESSLLGLGWINAPVNAGVADNQIFSVTQSDVKTIAQSMEAEGIRWTRSDKSAGSRVSGLQLMRDRLKNAIDGEGEALYFCENCVGSISTLPILPRDVRKVDDVDTKAEDHIFDAVRYRVLDANKRFAKALKIKQTF